MNFTSLMGWGLNQYHMVLHRLAACYRFSLPPPTPFNSFSFLPSQMEHTRNNTMNHIAGMVGCRSESKYDENLYDITFFLWDIPFILKDIVSRLSPWFQIFVSVSVLANSFLVSSSYRLQYQLIL